MGFGFFKPIFYGYANSRYGFTANVRGAPSSVIFSSDNIQIIYRIIPREIQFLRFF